MFLSSYLLQPGHSNYVFSMVLLNSAEDKPRLLSGSLDSTPLRLWDLQSGECIGAHQIMQNSNDLGVKFVSNLVPNLTNNP